MNTDQKAISTIPLNKFLNRELNPIVTHGSNRDDERQTRSRVHGVLIQNHAGLK
jgi:hypothetical protein